MPFVVSGGPEVREAPGLIARQLFVRGAIAAIFLDTMMEAPMPKIGSKVLRFTQSTAADLTGNRIRVTPDGTPFSYDLPAATLLGLVPDEDGFTRVDLATLPLFEDLEEGTYDVWITALDDNEPEPNESDPLEVADAVFDFDPPAAPTDGVIE